MWSLLDVEVVVDADGDDGKQGQHPGLALHVANRHRLEVPDVTPRLVEVLAFEHLDAESLVRGDEAILKAVDDCEAIPRKLKILPTEFSVSRVLARQGSLKTTVYCDQKSTAEKKPDIACPQD
jgi:hypothetical protein